jgi:signal transduction histidine kinase
MRRVFVALGPALAAVAIVALIAGVLLGAAPAPLEGPRLLEVVADVAIGAIVLALLVALWVVRGHARRIERLSAALAAWERGGERTSLHLDEAGGDEVARLATQLERITARAGERAQRLQATDRERDELLANVAHDLRTPLASMRGYLELILVRDGPVLSVDARNDLQTAVRQADRLGRRVADLLELAGLVAGPAAPEREAFELSELAHDLVQRHAVDAGRRAVRLAVERGDTPVRVEAELAGVERVLGVLLDNALRHTPAGGSVRIQIAPEGTRARVAVSDDGEGLEPAALAAVFDRYRRTARTGPPDRPGGHGGLSLAIARRIVEHHGGSLVLESAPGRGTRAMFDLPLAPLTASIAASRQEAS